MRDIFDVTSTWNYYASWMIGVKWHFICNFCILHLLDLELNWIHLAQGKFREESQVRRPSLFWLDILERESRWLRRRRGRRWRHKRGRMLCVSHTIDSHNGGLQVQQCIDIRMQNYRMKEGKLREVEWKVSGKLHKAFFCHWSLFFSPILDASCPSLPLYISSGRAKLS